MILIGNIPVMTTVYEILLALQRELQLNRSGLLHTIVQPKNDWQDIQITCPFHKYGLEQKPSCGVTVREKKRGNKIIPAGTYYCFSCSSRGDITDLISYCFGQQDGGLYGQQWILSHFNNFEVENREGFFKKLCLTNEKNVVEYVTESELEKYRFTHPYMYKRGLTDELIDVFDIGYDKDFRLREDLNPIPCVTFPVRDYGGNVVFIARRSIKGKIFWIETSIEKPIYGLYESRHIFKDSKELWVCESIFNALTLIKLGIPGVALFGTGSFSQIDTLNNLDYRKYVICLDADEAGTNATYKLLNKINGKLLYVFRLFDTTKDINDYSNVVDSKTDLFKFGKIYNTYEFYSKFKR